MQKVFWVKVPVAGGKPFHKSYPLKNEYSNRLMAPNWKGQAGNVMLKSDSYCKISHLRNVKE